MKQYILVRIFYSLLMLLGTMVIIFILVRMMPGDPIRAAMQQNAEMNDEKIIQQIRARHGLDKPVPVQFVIWATDFVTGDWGVSIGSGQKVMDMFLS